MSKTKIIAIDFDGTLCEACFPNIGAPYIDIIDAAKKEQSNGAKLILWTVRNNEYLQDAINWCQNFGLYFDAVNDNIEEIKNKGFTSPKILATEYWDDRAIVCNKGIKQITQITDIKETACKIIDIFEELLDHYNIDIPDIDREGNNDESHIYGTTYYALEDTIMTLLSNEERENNE